MRIYMQMCDVNTNQFCKIFILSQNTDLSVTFCIPVKEGGRFKSGQQEAEVRGPGW